MLFLMDWFIHSRSASSASSAQSAVKTCPAPHSSLRVRCHLHLLAPSCTNLQKKNCGTFTVHVSGTYRHPPAAIGTIKMCTKNEISGKLYNTAHSVPLHGRGRLPAFTRISDPTFRLKSVAFALNL